MAESGNASTRIESDVQSTGSVLLPPGFTLNNISFSRSGNDLILTAQDGGQIAVEGFFESSIFPNLIDPSGTLMSGGAAAVLTLRPAGQNMLEAATRGPTSAPDTATPDESPAVEIIGAEPGDEEFGSIDAAEFGRNQSELGFDLDADNAPKNGNVVINPDGSYLYTADEGFSGEDSFTVIVRAADGAIWTKTIRIVVSDPESNDLENGQPAEFETAAGGDGSTGKNGFIDQFFAAINDNASRPPGPVNAGLAGLSPLAPPPLPTGPPPRGSTQTTKRPRPPANHRVPRRPSFKFRHWMRKNPRAMPE